MRRNTPSFRAGIQGADALALALYGRALGFDIFTNDVERRLSAVEVRCRTGCGIFSGILSACLRSDARTNTIAEPGHSPPDSPLTGRLVRKDKVLSAFAKGRSASRQS